jgi:hypothetical protein
MELLGDGLVTMLNGLGRLFSMVLSPLTVIVALLAISLIWLSLIEIDELNRQGSKPDVQRH